MSSDAVLMLGAAAVVVGGAVVVTGTVVGTGRVLGSSPGSTASTAAVLVVVVLARSVAPSTVACAPDSVAPGTTAMATAEATAKGRIARAPFRNQSGIYQEEHK